MALVLQACSSVQPPELRQRFFSERAAELLVYKGTRCRPYRLTPSPDRIPAKSLQSAEFSSVISALLLVLAPDDLMRQLAVYATLAHAGVIIVIAVCYKRRASVTLSQSRSPRSLRCSFRRCRARYGRSSLSWRRTRSLRHRSLPCWARDLSHFRVTDSHTAAIALAQQLAPADAKAGSTFPTFSAWFSVRCERDRRDTHCRRSSSWRAARAWCNRRRRTSFSCA